MEFLFILMEMQVINRRSKNCIIINANALNEFDYPLFSIEIRFYTWYSINTQHTLENTMLSLFICSVVCYLGVINDSVQQFLLNR